MQTIIQIQKKWIFSHIWHILSSVAQRQTSLNMPVARPRYEIDVIKFSVWSETRKMDFVSNFS